jgi:hypothetical protein
LDFFKPPLWEKYFGTKKGTQIFQEKSTPKKYMLQLCTSTTNIKTIIKITTFFIGQFWRGFFPSQPWGISMVGWGATHKEEDRAGPMSEAKRDRE